MARLMKEISDHDAEILSQQRDQQEISDSLEFCDLASRNTSSALHDGSRFHHHAEIGCRVKFRIQQK